MLFYNKQSTEYEELKKGLHVYQEFFKWNFSLKSRIKVSKAGIYPIEEKVNVMNQEVTHV